MPLNYLSSCISCFSVHLLITSLDGNSFVSHAFWFFYTSQIFPKVQRMQHRGADQFLCFIELYFKGEPCYLVKQKGLHVSPLDKHTFPEKTRTQLHFNLLEEASATSSWTV
ncbi:hypothetical protein AMECASPLE_022737 [Ameca splendens]|uniref:Uncharacterized protein n=1 Tax=Ameca splendens TaxID=208324 RepID=A0ABV0YRD1_9TELE